MDRLLVDQEFILEKYPGKGGWTYVVLPGIHYKKKTRNGMIKVWGHIDKHVLKNLNLFSAGKGKFFLPVKAEIRKNIGKQEGDKVYLVLYAEDDSAGALDELLLCLEDSPEAKSAFINFAMDEQKALISWIEASGNEDVRVSRLARTIDLLEQGLKFTDLRNE
jgi:hypothetical protein